MSDVFEDDPAGMEDVLYGLEPAERQVLGLLTPQTGTYAEYISRMTQAVDRLEIDGGQSANFRVLCDGDHDECDLRTKEAREREQETVRAVGQEVHA